MDALRFAVECHRDDSVPQFLDVRRVPESAAAAIGMPHEEIDGVGSPLDEDAAIRPALVRSDAVAGRSWAAAHLAGVEDGLRPASKESS